MWFVRDFYRERLGISSWTFFPAIISLWIGAAGQSALYGLLVRQYFKSSILGLVFTLPCLGVFVVTYLRIPILPPRPFRLVLIFAMSWYVFFTILAEILISLGYAPPESPAYAFRISRGLMYVGWLSSIPLVYSCIAIRRHELKTVPDTRT